MAGSHGAPGPQRRHRYHHGDLKAALIDTAVELVTEDGVAGFSLAQATRRLGVAASAPYAHFAGREDLLAAVAVRAYDTFREHLVPEMDRFDDPAGRLAAMVAAYVRFAASNGRLVEAMYGTGLDKSRHPEIAAAAQPVDDAFLACVVALPAGSTATAADLAVAVEAVVQGHVTLLQQGDFGSGIRGVNLAAERAARATVALIAGRDLLSRPAPRPARRRRTARPRA
jgi:AcrR family transcriptional regulator